MKEWIRYGRTVVLESRNGLTVNEPCDGVVWIEAGLEIASGTPEDICPRYMANDRQGDPQ